MGAAEVSEGQQQGATFNCQRCEKTANMFCPKCINMALPKHIGAYCSQECFKDAWQNHKAFHQVNENSYMYVINRGRSRANEMPSFGYTGSLRPYRVAPRNVYSKQKGKCKLVRKTNAKRRIPDSIQKPDYYQNGFPEEEQKSKYQQIVKIMNPQQIESIRKVCRMSREILDKAHAMIRPGLTTNEIDKMVHNTTIEMGAYPSPFNYGNFPKSVCTSVNEVVCHGIPDMRELQNGDIVNVDVTTYYDGVHGDLNETYIVGDTDAASKKLVKTTYECLMKALDQVKPGFRFRDVGDIIQQHANANNLSVVKTYCGHGCNDLFHCAPTIPHYANNKAVGIMKAGQVFTVEPMINLGKSKDMMWPDNWTSVTRDGKRSAQFEHQVLVTEQGCEILTARLPTSPPLFWEK